MSQTLERKLHLGCGGRHLGGWLNTDLQSFQDVMCLDATRPYPFADETFAYVFSEHMIEHVSYDEGLSMLRECYRVMRAGGLIRIVTPDLVNICALYATEHSDIQNRYYLWFCQTFLGESYPHKMAFLLNAMARYWGHQFLYDEEALTFALQKVGFHSVTRCKLGESAHPVLQKIENTGRYPDGLLEYESVALEAQK